MVCLLYRFPVYLLALLFVFCVVFACTVGLMWLVIVCLWFLYLIINSVVYFDITFACCEFLLVVVRVVAC